MHLFSNTNSFLVKENFNNIHLKYCNSSLIIFEVTKNYSKVNVKDAGIGAASDDVPYIANKFYTGEKITKYLDI